MLHVRRLRDVSVAFWLIVLIQGCADEPEISACCSCVCETSDKLFCGGARRNALGAESCSEACNSYCAQNSCRLSESEVIGEGKCLGGLMPFL